MDPAITRRDLIGLLLTEFVRFPDPATETPVVRLTNPAYTNVLPAAENRFVSTRPHLLYFSSDRIERRLQPFEADLRSGVVKEAAKTVALDPLSLALDGQGRSLYFLDGGSLVMSRPKREVVAEHVTAFALGKSRGELYAIAEGKLARIEKRGVTAGTIASEAEGPCAVRPGERGGCLFQRAQGRELWYAPLSGAPVRLAAGEVRSPRWSASGESLFFLRDVPAGSVMRSEIHEVKPEEGTERFLLRTSQYAAFSPNGDDSVFVGASKSKAQPYVLLLLRATGREMALCEHRSSDAGVVSPVFAPDSRRVYFQSDREGRMAIYSVNVERLIEPTE